MADALESRAAPCVRPDPDPLFLELAILALGVRKQTGAVRLPPLDRQDRKAPPKFLSRYFQLKRRLEQNLQACRDTLPRTPRAK
jgi:hypothetical protein